MAYFINLFTEETWQESRENASWAVTGHTERLRNRGRIQPGDIFLCWLTRISAFVGALRVTGDSFESGADGPRIWRRDLFPLRYPTELVVRVAVTDGIPLGEIRAHSSNPGLWRWIFRNSGNEIPAEDASWIMAQLESRPQLGPDDPEPAAISEPNLDENGDGERPPTRRDTGHSRAQLQLARIGDNAGLDIWIARNDRSHEVDGVRLGDLSVAELPPGLPDDALRTVGLIDVLWLHRNRYVAGFEIETTTRIFTGLLRMGDLIASLPNFQILLFIVAPEERREDVFAQLGRPLFRYGLDPPLDSVCRFISLEALAESFDQYAGSPGIDATRFVDEIAESAGE